MAASKRSYGTGQLYVKSGSYYGRWRTSDDRKLNRKVGLVRVPGTSDGLTRTQAERRFVELQQEEEVNPRRLPEVKPMTVGDASVVLRNRLEIEGSRKSYLKGCESMERCHVVPALGDMKCEDDSELGVEVCDLWGHVFLWLWCCRARHRNRARRTRGAGATMEGGRGAGLGLGDSRLRNLGSLFAGGRAAAVGKELDLADDAMA